MAQSKVYLLKVNASLRSINKTREGAEEAKKKLMPGHRDAFCHLTDYQYSRNHRWTITKEALHE